MSIITMVRMAKTWRHNVIYVYTLHTYKNIKIDINEIKLEWAAAILRLIKLFRNYIVYTPAVSQQKTTAQKLIKRLSAERRKLTFGRFSRMTTLLVGVLINCLFISFIPSDGYDSCTSVCSYWNDYIFYNIPRSILRVQLCQCIYIIMQPYPYIPTIYDSPCHSDWSSFNTWVINHRALSSW